MFFFAEQLRSTQAHARWATLAILFGLGAGAVSLFLWPIATPPSGWLSVAVFTLGNALTLILTGRRRRGIYLTLLTAICAGSFLANGPSTILITAFGGVALEEVLRAVLGRQLVLERHTLRQSAISIALCGGTAVCSVLIGGAAYQAIGGPVPLFTLELIDFPALGAFGVVSYACHACVLVCACRAVYPDLTRRRALELVVFSSSVEFFMLLPIGALFAIFAYRLSTLNFLGCWLILLLGAALVRFMEVSHDQLEERVRALAVMNAFSEAVSSHLSMADLLNTLDREISSIVPNDFLLISLRDPFTREWSFPLVRSGNQRLVWGSIASPTTLGDYLMQTRQPLLMARDIPAQLATLKMQDFRPPIPVSMISLPLITGSQVIGVMSIESFAPDRTYTQADVDVLQTIIPQVAAALNNAQLYLRTETMAGELSQLNEVSRVISATLDLDTVLRTICDALQQMLHTPTVGVVLAADEAGIGNALLPGYVAHLPAPIRAAFEAVASDTETFRTLPARGIRTLRIGPPTETVGLPPERSAALEAACRDSQVRTLIIADLRIQERLIGQIILAFEKDHTLSGIDERLLNTLANQATIAISNAELYQETQRRADEMKDLVEASHALIESFEISFVGTTTADRLRSTLDIDEVALFLWDSEREQFEPIVSAMNRLPDYEPFHESLFMPVIQTHAPVRVQRAEPRALPSLPSLPSPAEALALDQVLVVPIMLRSDAIGVAVLGRKGPRPLSVHEQQFAEALLHQTATALDNARLFNLIDTELEERVQQLSAIETVSRKLAATLDRSIMIREILDVALSITNADMVSFGLETAPGLMTFETRAQFIPETHKTMTVWQGITGRVMRTGRFVLTGDARSDPDYVAAVPGMQSELAVPIMLSGHPIGVLDLESSKPNAFNTAHLSFLTTLAEHAAIAIDKAQLFADIRRRNEEMRAILDSTRDGLVLLSPSGELLQANPAAERVLGMDLRGIVGRNLILRLARNDRRAVQDQRIRYPWARLRDMLRKLRTQPTMVTRLTYHAAAGDSLRQIEETGVPVLDDQGHVTARLFVLRDVTEEMELERFKEHLTDTVVHDLRSPLGSVITSLYLIDEASQDGDFETIRKVTPAALTLANDLLAMVTSILEVRKMQSGTLVLEKTMASLQVPAERAVQTVELLAQQYGITIDNRVPDDLPNLEMDVDKIRRVLVNLLDNALKFTPDKGQVRIEAALQKPGHVLVSVTDTGMGIPEDYRDRVFELFTTVPKELSTGRRRGTGIGLTFCRLTVEAHGGRIWADAGPEGGTAIHFTLPLISGVPVPVSQADGVRTAAAG